MNTFYTAENTFDIAQGVTRALQLKAATLAQERATHLQQLLEKSKSFKERGLVRQTRLPITNREDFYRLYAAP